MPRSGTTLVEQILSSHSLVIGLGEIEFIKKIASLAIERIPSKNLENIKYLSSRDRESLGNEYLRDINDLIDKYLINLKCKNELKIGACIYHLLSSKGIIC